MTVEAMDSFDFFGLPRELRDLIYDELDGHDQSLDLKGEADTVQGIYANDADCPYLRATAQRLPLPNYLLVNHPFSQEYLSRTTKASALVLDDHFGDPEDSVNIHLPPTVTSFTRLHFRLTIACGSTTHCRHMQELRAHLERAKHIAAQMPDLRHFTIELHCYSDSLEECLPDIVLRQKELEDVFPEGLTAMVGFQARHNLLSVEFWDYDVKGECVLVWDRPRRELVLVLGKEAERGGVEEVEVQEDGRQGVFNG